MTFAQIPWSLSVPIMVIAAMIIFRRPLGSLIGQGSHEFKAGRFFSWKARRPLGPTPQIFAQIAREIAQAPEEEHFDGRRLVIRDAQGRPRILASTVASGEPFLALIDEGGEIRCSLIAGQAADPDGVAAVLMFARRGSPTEMASFIGAENDGTGTLAIRDSAGAWKEMS
jgi:hypothetical protein